MSITKSTDYKSPHSQKTSGVVFRARSSRCGRRGRAAPIRVARSRRGVRSNAPEAAFFPFRAARRGVFPLVNQCNQAAVARCPPSASSARPRLGRLSAARSNMALIEPRRAGARRFSRPPCLFLSRTSALSALFSAGDGPPLVLAFFAPPLPCFCGGCVLPFARRSAHSSPASAPRRCFELGEPRLLGEAELGAAAAASSPSPPPRPPLTRGGSPPWHTRRSSSRALGELEPLRALRLLRRLRRALLLGPQRLRGSGVEAHRGGERLAARTPTCWRRRRRREVRLGDARAHGGLGESPGSANAAGRRLLRGPNPSRSRNVTSSGRRSGTEVRERPPWCARRTPAARLPRTAAASEARCLERSRLAGRTAATTPSGRPALGARNRAGARPRRTSAPRPVFASTGSMRFPGAPRGPCAARAPRRVCLRRRPTQGERVRRRAIFRRRLFPRRRWPSGPPPPPPRAPRIPPRPSRRLRIWALRPPLAAGASSDRLVRDDERDRAPRPPSSGRTASASFSSSSSASSASESSSDSPSSSSSHSSPLSKNSPSGSSPSPAPRES